MAVVWTIGHGAIPRQQLITCLQQYRIEVLVDVRSVPYSRYNPQYNRESLASALTRVGIEYQHMVALGGRPVEPEYYLSQHVPTGHPDYLKKVDYDRVAQSDRFRAGLHDLLSLATQRRVAIMCSEENPAQCHRHHLIAVELMKQGVTAWHLKRSGSTSFVAVDAREVDSKVPGRRSGEETTQLGFDDIPPNEDGSSQER